MTHGRAFRFRWKTSALNKLYNNFSVAVIFQGEHDHELINYILFGLHNAWHTLEKTKYYTFPVKGISQNFFTNIFQDSLKLRANYSVLKYFKETVHLPKVCEMSFVTFLIFPEFLPWSSMFYDSFLHVCPIHLCIY